jgi:hypothetical protein
MPRDILLAERRSAPLPFPLIFAALCALIER